MLLQNQRLQGAQNTILIDGINLQGHASYSKASALTLPRTCRPNTDGAQLFHNTSHKCFGIAEEH
jgi:hypothetical protein